MNNVLKMCVYSAKLTFKELAIYSRQSFNYY